VDGGCIRVDPARHASPRVAEDTPDPDERAPADNLEREAIGALSEVERSDEGMGRGLMRTLEIRMDVTQRWQTTDLTAKRLRL